MYVWNWIHESGSSNLTSYSFMKRYSIMAILAMISSTLSAQLDIKAFKKIQFGIMYDRTDMTGLYTLQNPYDMTMEVDLKDYRTTMNAEIKWFRSDESSVSTANLEGILYLFQRLIAMGGKKELFNDWDTPMDKLTAGDCHNVKLLSGDNYHEVAKFSNNHWLDVTVSRAIKDGPALIGINASFRTLGFPPRYTYYPTETPSDRYMISTVNGTWKILFGLNGGYRTSLGSKAALFVIGGVNTGWNKSKNDPNKGSAIQVKYNPFINPTLFFGGKFGGYVGLYWEMMKGKDVEVAVNNSAAVVGAPTPTVTSYKTKVSESQLQLKLGFYLSGKNE